MRACLTVMDTGHTKVSGERELSAATRTKATGVRRSPDYRRMRQGSTKTLTNHTPRHQRSSHKSESARPTQPHTNPRARRELLLTSATRMRDTPSERQQNRHRESSNSAASNTFLRSVDRRFGGFQHHRDWSPTTCRPSREARASISETETSRWGRRSEVQD